MTEQDGAVDKRLPMNVWLECRQCGEKEQVHERTKFVHCPNCNAPRYAVDDTGQPVIVWSKESEPSKW